MVQIIPRTVSTGERMAQAIKGFLSGAGQVSDIVSKEMQGRKERDQISELIGQDVSKIRDPQMLRMLTQNALQEKSNASMREQDMNASLMDYDTIKKFAGPEAADFYKASTTGGKTEIVKKIVDSLVRGEKFGDTLLGAISPGVEETPRAQTEDVINEQGKLNLPDYTKRPKGTTPASWETTRKEWTTTNVESLNNARGRLKAIKRDQLGTHKLMKINESGELPEGLERWIVNPKNGEIYGIAQVAGKAPVAAQEWVKEVSRFGNRAKDAYGSRVTNFDLYQYMKQFPTLLNTKEGRQNILNMMSINYELDALYDKAVQQIIDSKGAGNIPPEEVDRVARNMIAEDEERLFDEYLNLESKNDDAFVNEGLKQKERPSLAEIFGG